MPPDLLIAELLGIMSLFCVGDDDWGVIIAAASGSG
jgi:hypothetical protein